MQKDPCLHSGCKAGFSQAFLESFGILDAFQSPEFRLELVAAMNWSPTFQVIFVSACKGHTVPIPAHRSLLLWVHIEWLPWKKKYSLHAISYCLSCEGDSTSFSSWCLWPQGKRQSFHFIKFLYLPILWGTMCSQKAFILFCCLKS